MNDKDFNRIKISLASDEKIREWSYGEVKKPETINYRTLKPEKDGLFCEKIFGPTKDWECHCGKYKRVRYKGIICDRCGVEVTRSKVRRERIGHIELATPVAHIWYFKGVPSRLALVLNVSPKDLERVIYFASYIITSSQIPDLKEKDILSEMEYREAVETYGYGTFKAESGAEAVRKLLEKIDLDELSAEIHQEFLDAPAGRKGKILKRLETIEAFRTSGNRPEWAVLTILPVIPPDLRPMVQLDGGRFATSDLNDLYRRVLNRNNRLRRLLDLGAPDIIVRNEKRMLQESVDALLDNTKRGRPITGPGNRPLKSLSDNLKGKQGRFRQNLLGKRVDYSGRSVIVVGPELRMYQCGLPKEMAIELFKPFVMGQLIKRNIVPNIKAAKKMVDTQQEEIWDILDEVINDHPVLLNRAPTLHRLGVQAFEPVLVEGKAIHLHPLVCAAFNADFDGDQMPVHVPLSPEAQAEARYLMLSTNNLLKPQDGQPITVPSHDMITGSYYLTRIDEDAKGTDNWYKDPEEAEMAYATGNLSLHALINVKFSSVDEKGYTTSKIIKTTVGRILFNQAIPQDLGFVDRSNPDNNFELEINEDMSKKKYKAIVSRSIDVHGISKTAEILDNVMKLAFRYSTQSGLTVSIADATIPEAKHKILKEADKKVDEIYENFKQGLLSNEDRYNATLQVWQKATKDVTEAMEENFDNMNPFYLMARTGARGNINQLRQIAGMRGLMADTTGKVVEIPIKASFREGLDALEYFISSHGARKGLSDTALRTANAGYLTRRLVDVAQDIIIREDDCGTDMGLKLYEIVGDGRVVEKLEERMIGRYPLKAIKHPKTNKVIVAKTEIITEAKANEIIEAGITEVEVRSSVGCKTKHGVCRTCYGKSLAAKELVNIGDAVGIIAAQAIGEPGTQMTMRTFHSGGVASADDITQGLPRIEELFEARNPKGVAVISEIDGIIKLNQPEDKKKSLEIIIIGKNETKTYIANQKLFDWVIDGAEAKAGQPLTEGSINPNELLVAKGPSAVFEYIMEEAQKTYRNQGIDINDKHIEIIIRQMLKKVKITDPGDSGRMIASLIELTDFYKENDQLKAEGKKQMKGNRTLLGITKASISTESFLSAASFQETTRVLTDAAIKGKVDELIGLKENVIIGKLIPAGAGLSKYREIKTNTLDDKERIEKILALKEKYQEDLDI